MIESNSVRRALARMREQISPTRDDKARLRARVLGTATLLGPDSAGPDATQLEAATAPTAAVSLTPWAALKAAGSAGAAAGLVLLGVGGGVGFWLGQETASVGARHAAVVEAPARAEAVPTAVIERALSVPVPGTTQPAATPAASLVVELARAPTARHEAGRGADAQRADVPPRAHAARRRAPPNPIDAELALLRRVERALRNNDPTLARALLGELDERFPDSRLGEERSAARCIADCRSAEPGASESARAFLREHGASVYRRRIVLACALDGELGDSGGEGTKSVGRDAPMKK